MTTMALREAKELVAKHVKVLEGYAHRVLEQREPLSETEEADRERRISEFQAMGSCLKLTQREMVALVYRDLFESRRSCGCPTCRSRAANGE